MDGAVGMNEGNTSMPTDDPKWWAEHRGRLERAARDADSAG
ncbi:hypothetical protein [Streptomyces sp. NPDC054842]